MTLREKIGVIHAQSKFSSAGVKRLGFPDFWTDDGPMGVRPDVLWDEWVQAGQTNDSCVAFPALTCLAATFNPDMSRLYGVSLGEEALYRGKAMLLGPGININRTPLGGRNFEYMGEDPYLVSQMVVPYIEGLQSKGVAACVKHFCLNNDEQFRNNVNAVISDRALYEIYLPGFRAAVQDAKVMGVMGGYNLYRGQHNSTNKYLLNDILKGEWGFDGVVVSDWGAVHNTDEAVLNGVDMEFGSWTNGMNWGVSNAYDNYYMANPYMQGIRDGKYSEEQLNDKVRRVLRTFYRTTMNRNKGYGFLCSDEHYAAARRIAEEGIVLLKNDRVSKKEGPVLPIATQRVRKALIVGENALKMMTVGGGSSSLKVQHEITPFAGLKARLEKDGVEVIYERGYVGDVKGEYDGVKTGQDLTESRTAEQLVADACAAAKDADVVIFIGGLNKADHQDAEGTDRESFDLPYGQNQVVEALVNVNPRLVYVNISGNAAHLSFVKQVPAIVQGWYNGSEAGVAIASVLCGDANPSGKLPMTWNDRLEDYAAHALNTYPGTWRDDKKEIIDEEYKEGVFVGYRWNDLKKIKPVFAFGHGLSYTTFALSNLRSSSTRMLRSGTITFTVTVKNIGPRAGAEVVQLYIHDSASTVERPYKELKGFQKVYLQPGESKDVSITINAQSLSFFDEATHAWKAELGDFTALVGNSSDNLPLRARFTLE
ncbi:MAG: glycoside hydrolase family 3 C-terminal domain-containing protein [Bacteroidaceae bacterium]|nr:glycoside hydrolase family 3 C-terminal domain-containing protein [Bacteroidaceae bacterium]